ncbi:hypothetical protein KQ313_14555 [Synechococcus sp. CS-1325]|uniref:hypothetical protein n=1 Tax=unclassified Synechococcus TaxID=2626047 RepID=UPI000DB04E0D|nr:MULTISPECIES: hypothetical protein [unclassified Synechococcus]PZU96628.1 MAG: hypothetical protein DCF24_13790 [Cyanobium sp.]MCT0200891.1 hypothetical protein [Synechococcus sp. CS-1325]MCT0213929.1 hypothetical protein [Synechococcus sp. CS-1326]MCT0230831.1 hypothetical protein [Synechococcus sp. CS-1324]MCT0233505.1 hypothetical protein [Synechococcus sp. CS-1327]
MRRLRLPLMPVLLILLALWDLRAELQLISDHFTWVTLRAALVQHPLAVAVLLLAPDLIRRYRQKPAASRPAGSSDP